MSRKDRFYIQGTNFRKDSTVTLNEDESHHLSRVLRFSEGEKIEIFDGNGGVYSARIEDIDKTTTVRISEVLGNETEPPIELILIQSIPKKADMDIIVRMGTEIGVTTFIPLLSERTEVYSQKRLQDKLNRWRRITIAACKQCGRNNLPEIHNPAKPEEALDTGADLKLILNKNSKAENPFTRSGKIESALLAIGPEGGWKESELRLAGNCGFEELSLGSRILRTKTAGIVASTLIQNKFGDLKENSNRQN